MIIEIRDEVVSLSGVLQRNHWHTLESAVKVRLKHHPAGIVVDCGGLESVTPEGADTFRDAARHIARTGKGARFVLANVPASVMGVLRQIPNLGSQLPVAETVADARISLGLPADTGASGAAAAAADAEQGETVSIADDDTPENSVLVGLFGSDVADPHAVAVGCRLAAAGKGAEDASGLCLTYLLQVPRQMPLMSPMAAEEEAARQALERFDAAVRARSLRPFTRVERTRDPAQRLVDVASEIHARSIVLAVAPEGADEMNRIAASVVARASCNVIVNRLPLPARAPAAAGAAGASPESQQQGTSRGRRPRSGNTAASAAGSSGGGGGGGRR